MDRIPGRNIAIKIFALILATVLWMYVMNEQNPPIEASFTIPIEMRNLSAGLMLVDAPETVRIKVRGPRSVVVGVSSKDITCYIDLKDLKEGRHTLKVNAAIPQFLELIEVNPDKAAVRIDVSSARQFPIEVRVKGTAASGTMVGKALVNPAQVRLEGPKGQLDLVDKVIAVVDITGKDTDINTQVPLQAINRDGNEIEGLTIIPDKTDVSVNILRQENKKTVNVKAVLEGNLPQGLALKKVMVKPDKIEVMASKDVVDKLSTINTEPIDMTVIEKDTIREVKLQLPEGVNVSQNTVTISILVEGTPR